MRGFFVPLLFLFIIMGNKQTYWPSLGDAANAYRLPSEGARQQALSQDQLVRTLNNDGREWVHQKTAKLRKLHPWTHIPAAYEVDETWTTQTTHAIERDPAAYEHIFSKAKQDALALQLQCDDCSEEEILLMHIYFIQQAINQLLRPDQTQAEGNMHRLVEETSQAGETTISTAQIEARNAEVCTMKSLIAQHYLQENCPGVTVTMLSETGYKWGNEGHNYLQIQQWWNVHEYHANSPHYGLPHMIWLSKEQEQLLLELQKMNTTKEKQTPSAQIRQLTPNNYHRLAA